MATGKLAAFLERVGGPDGADKQSDRFLLARFVVEADEQAFGVLVARHGPMVMDVCRRMLPDPAAADDAFQATLLVLARRAASIRDPDLLGNWLYGVAYRTATRARAAAARRRTRESEQPQRTISDPIDEMSVRELFAALDKELNRLTFRFRAPLVLCYLEGKSRAEAARALGYSLATLDRRLEAGRNLLRARLTRLGFGACAAFLPVLLSQTAMGSHLPLPFRDNLVRAAAEVAAGGARVKSAASETPPLSPSVVALTEEVLTAMFMNKVKSALIYLSFFALVIAGARWLLPNAGAARGSEDEVVLRTTAPRVVEEPSKPVKKNDPAKPRILKAEGFVYRLAWSPDASIMAGIGLNLEHEEKEIDGKKQKVPFFNSTLQFWDARTGEVKRSLGKEQKVRMEAIAISRDGKLAAVAARIEGDRVEPYEVRLVDIETGTIKKTIEQDKSIRALAFSPDGKVLAIGGQHIPEELKGPFKRTIRLWDMEKQKVTGEFEQELDNDQPLETGTLDGLRDLVYSRDGKLLASADADWKVRLLDAHTGKLQKTLSGHTSTCISVAFSPNGKTLVTSGADESVRIWDVQSGDEIRKLPGHKSPGSVIAFSPDGRYLATAGGVIPKDGIPKKDGANGVVPKDGAKALKGTGEVILWDTNNWEQKKVLTSDGGPISTISFSPGDETTLAAGGMSVRLWSLREVLAEQK